MIYDVAVIGLGAMGSAALAQCAGRGASCIGLEQFTPAHHFGSSHGKSRLIRKAYFEDPAYVPLLHRTYDLWRELERESGEELLRITGLLTVGESGSELITGTERAAREHNLALEIWSPADVRARFPMLQLRAGEVGLFEGDGGVLAPERAVSAQLRLAQSRGAQTSFGVAMERWEPSGTGFRIRTSEGAEMEARSLILTLGPWFQETLESLGVSIRVQRNVQAWFAPATKAYEAASRFPAFLINRPDLPAPLYGVPDFSQGLKAAFHGLGEFTVADRIDRMIDPARDLEPLVRAMEQWMPGSTASRLGASACMYTLTPDQHFVIDRHPEHPQAILCGGFSGHGFKFAPVVGEIAADLALEAASRHQIDFLSLRRFRR